MKTASIWGLVLASTAGGGVLLLLVGLISSAVPTNEPVVGSTSFSDTLGGTPQNSDRPLRCKIAASRGGT